MLLLSLVTLAMLLASGVALLAPDLAQARTTGTTFTVNSTAQDPDSDTWTNNVCDTDPSTEGEQCTLRAAIEQADETAAADTINFNIPTTDPGYNPATGVFTIAFVPRFGPDGISAYEPVTIDGYSQPGAKENTLAVGNDAVLKIELVYDSDDAANQAPLSIQGDGSVVRGLAINGFDTNHVSEEWCSEGLGGGIHVHGADNVVVEGNFLGTDASGTAPNSVYEMNGVGVLVYEADNTTIGGTTPAARNLISGNERGLFLVSSNGTKVKGNYIGPDKSGSAALTSGLQREGVFISNSSNSIIGGRSGEAGNIIAYNKDVGVLVGENKSTPCNPTSPAKTTAKGNSILFNSIFSNVGLGIDLVGGTEDGSERTRNDRRDSDTGANGLQNFPVITSAVANPDGTTTIEGNLNSHPSKSYVIQLFSNPEADPSGYGEGESFLRQTTVMTNRKGNRSFTITVDQDLAGQFVTATATNATGGGTSEFSRAVEVVQP